MIRQPHDQFAKSLLSEFLSLYGSAVVNMEVSDELRFVDSTLSQLGILLQIGVY